MCYLFSIRYRFPLFLYINFVSGLVAVYFSLKTTAKQLLSHSVLFVPFLSCSSSLLTRDSAVTLVFLCFFFFLPDIFIDHLLIVFNIPCQLNLIFCLCFPNFCLCRFLILLGRLTSRLRFPSVAFMFFLFGSQGIWETFYVALWAATFPIFLQCCYCWAPHTDYVLLKLWALLDHCPFIFPSMFCYQFLEAVEINPFEVQCPCFASPAISFSENHELCHVMMVTSSEVSQHLDVHNQLLFLVRTRSKTGVPSATSSTFGRELPSIHLEHAGHYMFCYVFLQQILGRLNPTDSIIWFLKLCCVVWRMPQAPCHY